jgi:hypothetical protein
MAFGNELRRNFAWRRLSAPGGRDQIHKGSMDSKVSGQFWMKRGCHRIPLSNEAGQTVTPGEDLNPGSRLNDARGTDIDHFQRPTRQGGFTGQNCRVNLSPKCVSLNNDVEDTEASLGGIADLAGEQDSSCASPENRALTTETLQIVKESMPIQKLEHRCGLAAGEDQSIETRQLIGLANFNGSGASLSDRRRVSRIVPLNG